MAKFKDYIEYYKSNPEGYWFKRRLFGWGWTPVRWQGWCVTILYIVLILTLALNKEKDIPGNPDSGSNMLTFAVPVIILTILFIIVAYKKGEKPRWQWGLPKKDEDKK